ncbi:hypothetical protein WJX73_003677 [Symbiochloris irregularis]|uniref:Chalcone synthase n=1 Tax=Symbiochloris irregularis TaxID=706552 RepID=A0AAW1PBR1_9CHLO
MNMNGVTANGGIHPALHRADSPFVLASSASFPEHCYTADEVMEACVRQHNFPPAAEKFARRVFPATSVKTGNIALPPEQLGMPMDRETFRRHLHTALKDLSLKACREAVADWGGSFSDITHIVWATMSSVVDVPSMDCVLVNELKLKPTVRRLAVQQMGCLSGFRCLNLAAELSINSPAARILVCVADIRSGLQNQLPINEDGSYSKAAVLSCALFRDAASAVIVGSRPRHFERPRAEWVTGASLLAMGSLDVVTSTDGNSNSIHWNSDMRMPPLVEKETPEIIRELVSGLDFEIAADDTQFVVHTGGPAILTGTQNALGITAEQMQASWDFMESHGNTSGSSNLAILHHEFTRAPTGPFRHYIVCIAGGPGVCIEASLLRRIQRPMAGQNGHIKADMHNLAARQTVSVPAPFTAQA